MLKQAILTASALCAFSVYANAAIDVPIEGNIESKCVITTDTPGVFGNPTPDALSTLPTDGGVMPIIRYDIIEADYYKAQITWPNQFSTSPVLNDVVNWDGEVEVSEVSDSTMDFETDKVEWENVTEFDLDVAGSAWFKVTSEAEYGYGKSFPGGVYRAVVGAECIAK